jgi:hypothetical protein
MEAAMCVVGDDGGHDAAEALLGRWLLLSYLGRLRNPKVAFLIRFEGSDAERWRVAG